MHFYVTKIADKINILHTSHCSRHWPCHLCIYVHMATVLLWYLASYVYSFIKINSLLLRERAPMASSYCLKAFLTTSRFAKTQQIKIIKQQGQMYDTLGATIKNIIVNIQFVPVVIEISAFKQINTLLHYNSITTTSTVLRSTRKTTKFHQLFAYFVHN